MEKALLPKVELGVCSIRSKSLLFRSSLLKRKISVSSDHEESLKYIYPSPNQATVRVRNKRSRILHAKPLGV